MRILIATILAVLFGTAEAGQTGGQWRTINPDDGYQSEGSGDPMGEGARVVVRSVGDPSGRFGGAIARIDAAALRDRRVVLSSRLNADAGTNGVAIWLRADGTAGKLRFVTSAHIPVIGGQGSTHREIAMLVPEEAVSLVYGVVMSGKGAAEATDFRIRIDHAPLPGSNATAQEVLDAAIGIVRDNALKAESIDWDVIPQKLRAATSNARRPEEVHPAIRELLALLGDGHSYFMSRDIAEQYERMAGPTAAPVVRVLADGVGYVSVPGFRGRNEEEARKFSASIANGIEEHRDAATNGWIVDLRENRGGNMWPMLSALSALLGDGEVGYFKGKGAARDWVAGRVEGVGASAGLQHAKVAVLIGSKTSSSGEAVAVAFHGRPATRSFGQLSSGRSTSNTTYSLPDGSQIQLTTAVAVDRNGMQFGGRLEPDELTPVADQAHDPALESAKAWLLRPSASNSKNTN